MNRFWILILFCCPVLASAQEGIEALLVSSCLECHDDATEKGGLSLETLELGISDKNADVWLRCLEQIENGFMPPAEKAQPTPDEREAAILDLEKRLVVYHSELPRPEGHTVLRRLNRTEYRNTIRDLLDMEPGAELTSEFPGDERFHGFATNGETLVTSSFLLRQYLETAGKIVEQAVHFEPKPESQHWEMRAPFDRTTGSEIGETVRYFEKVGEPQPYQEFYDRIGAGGTPYKGYHPIDDLNDGVALSGRYHIRIKVEGKFRHALEQDRFKRWPSLWDEAEPVRLSLFTASLEGIDPQNKEGINFAKTHEQANQKLIATWDLPDDVPTWLECKVWLESGQFLRIGFPNGPTNSNNRMLKYFDEMATDPDDPAKLEEHLERKKLYGGRIGYHFGESPRIRLHAIEMNGPVNEIWPPQSHREIFGDDPYQSEKAEQVLQHFASRAWRRPIEKSEIAPLLKLVREAEKEGMPAEAAIQEGITAILCSPDFIYREEKLDTLSDYELASRLSYFLWASMPDETLMTRAAAGELNPENLRAESERLLADEKSDAFVNEFLDGWLRLNLLGSMAPDPHRFRVYYDDRLEPAMRKETRLFFRHLLDTNGPIADFLDSDYTFVNESLSNFYGMDFTATEPPELDARHLRQDGLGHSPTTLFNRVRLTDERRGGLLGQGSILTLTANGVDTSPVIRGVWLLENILGTPPSPPPPDVPAIEPDIRGAKTIRDQLEKHRDSSACRSCHTHIDPPGFALESFDAIGNWRGHYRIGEQHVEIDSSGSFGNTDFSNIVQFKAELLKRQDAFARCLLEKLFIHALGRDLEVTDRPHLRKIVDSTKENGYPLRDLLFGVIQSELFRQK